MKNIQSFEEFLNESVVNEKGFNDVLTKALKKEDFDSNETDQIYTRISDIISTKTKSWTKPITKVEVQQIIDKEIKSFKKENQGYDAFYDKVDSDKMKIGDSKTVKVKGQEITLTLDKKPRGSMALFKVTRNGAEEKRTRDLGDIYYGY